MLQASLLASLEQERDQARAELAAQARKLADKAREVADKAREVAELQEQQRIDSSEADVLKTEVKAQQEQVNCELELFIGCHDLSPCFRSRP